MWHTTCRVTSDCMAPILCIVCIHGLHCVCPKENAFVAFRAVTPENLPVDEAEDDEEQHSAIAPPPVKKGHITIRQWAAYYLQIKELQYGNLSFVTKYVSSDCSRFVNLPCYHDQNNLNVLACCRQ